MSLIFYTNRLPDGVGGRAYGPVILIRPEYRNDVGIHKHEEEHVRQWLHLTLLSALVLLAVYWPLLPFAAGVFPILYHYSRQVRRWAEVRAYRVQMQYPNASRVFLTLDQAAARLLSPRYDLRLVFDQAKALLRG